MMPKPQSPIVEQYLDLMDEQREQVFNVLAGITRAQLWQRPAPKEWCIGEILNHNVLLLKSIFPVVRFSWRCFRWTAKMLKSRDYQTTIEDPYRKDKFPHWAGFLWTPKYTPERSVPLETLITETRQMHQAVRDFYADKDQAMLGRIFLFDPLLGFMNLIVTLRIGIYHDQLHYEDVMAMANRE
jgi:hypothetical protein